MLYALLPIMNTLHYCRLFWKPFCRFLNSFSHPSGSHRFILISVWHENQLADSSTVSCVTDSSEHQGCISRVKLIFTPYRNEWKLMAGHKSLQKHWNSPLCSQTSLGLTCVKLIHNVLPAPVTLFYFHRCSGSDDFPAGPTWPTRPTRSSRVPWIHGEYLYLSQSR